MLKEHSHMSCQIRLAMFLQMYVLPFLPDTRFHNLLTFFLMLRVRLLSCIGSIGSVNDGSVNNDSK